MDGGDQLAVPHQPGHRRLGLGDEGLDQEGPVRRDPPLEVLGRGCPVGGVIARRLHHDRVVEAGPSFDHGQIVQSGVFEGRAFATSKPVTVYFQLGMNREMASNNRYPEFVMKFDAHENEE